MRRVSSTFKSSSELLPTYSVGSLPDSSQFIGEKDNPFVAVAPVGDGCLTAVGDKRKLEDTVPTVPKFFGRAGARPSSNKIFGSAGALPSKTTCHSSIASRYSPPFQQEPRPPVQMSPVSVFVGDPFSFVAEVSAQNLPQLQPSPEQPHLDIPFAYAQHFRHLFR